jgi:hypothetical protein
MGWEQVGLDWGQWGRWGDHCDFNAQPFHGDIIVYSTLTQQSFAMPISTLIATPIAVLYFAPLRSTSLHFTSQPSTPLPSTSLHFSPHTPPLPPPLPVLTYRRKHTSSPPKLEPQRDLGSCTPSRSSQPLLWTPPQVVGPLRGEGGPVGVEGGEHRTLRFVIW